MVTIKHSQEIVGGKVLNQEQFKVTYTPTYPLKLGFLCYNVYFTIILYMSIYAERVCGTLNIHYLITAFEVYFEL
jgi:hypothetical protein